MTPPGDLTTEEWWLGIKLARGNLWHSLPLTDSQGRNFGYCIPDPVYEMTHLVDRQASGEIAISEVVTSPEMRKRYLVSSLIEEAVTSSQLEGASTSPAVAKEMLRSGRQPRDRSEQMIFNNYRAMNAVRSWKDQPLSPDRVLQLHRIVTDGTLDDPDAAGRLQRPDEERVRVFDRATGELRHTPPPAEQLHARLEAMCAFANDEPTEGFLHPVIRSILLHFWLAYDHPFEDGNGRTARAIFYWSMLKHGFWLTEFLSISTILKRAPGQYGRAFLYAETDGLDTTYFVLNQLKVICRDRGAPRLPRPEGPPGPRDREAAPPGGPQPSADRAAEPRPPASRCGVHLPLPPDESRSRLPIRQDRLSRSRATRPARSPDRRPALRVPPCRRPLGPARRSLGRDGTESALSAHG